MKINIKTCEFCRYCTNVAFDDAGINYWCRNINIPLFTPDKTVCDNYQKVKNFSSHNGYNFREVEEDE